MKRPYFCCLICYLVICSRLKHNIKSGKLACLSLLFISSLAVSKVEYCLI